VSSGLITPNRRARRSWSMLMGARASRVTVDRLLCRLSHGSLQVHVGGQLHEYGNAAGDPAVIHIRDDRFWRSVACGGALGAADAWIQGWWDSPNLTTVLRLFIRNLPATDQLEGQWAWIRMPVDHVRRFLNRNTVHGSLRNIHAHYDLGTQFFETFLDETLTYSAGIFEHAESDMASASLYKLDRLLSKVGVTAHEHLLEIGTGWGSLAIRAAETIDCKVTSTTISSDQFSEATKRVRGRNLQDRITLLQQDYRALSGSYDQLVSIEMIEAVGHAYLTDYFSMCGSLVKPKGRIVLQTISMPDDRYQRYLRTNDFIREVVFPGSCCPALSAMVEAAHGAGLEMIDLEEMNYHYAQTLRVWSGAFDAAHDHIVGIGYDEQFIRMWRYYLAYCEAGFAENHVRSLQLVFARQGMASAVEIPPLPKSHYGSLQCRH
jgi:cyclopropane-fatty-acyl-phospholipid synthase